MPSTAQRLLEFESLEELFALFHLDFDPQLVSVRRLQILKRFGESIAVLEAREPAPAAAELPLLYASLLLQAHDSCIETCCDSQPVFVPRQQLVQLRAKK